MGGWELIMILKIVKFFIFHWMNISYMKLAWLTINDVTRELITEIHSSVLLGLYFFRNFWFPLNQWTILSIYYTGCPKKIRQIKCHFTPFLLPPVVNTNSAIDSAGAKVLQRYETVLWRLMTWCRSENNTDLRQVCQSDMVAYLLQTSRYTQYLFIFATVKCFIYVVEVYL